MQPKQRDTGDIVVGKITALVFDSEKAWTWSYSWLGINFNHSYPKSAYTFQEAYDNATLLITRKTVSRHNKK